jgi:hypothetical protein
MIASMKQPMYSKRPSVMSTARQRFRFIVEFAGLDLERFRATDWLYLSEALRDFLLPTHSSLRPGGLHLWPTEHPQPEEYGPEDFRALQAEVRDVLALIVASRSTNQMWTYKPIQFRYAAPHVPDQAAQPGRHFFSVQGHTRDLVLLALGWLLTQVDTATLARCPVCDTIFLRKSNQAYCSRACTNHVSYHRWQQRQTEAADTPVDVKMC